MRALISTVPTQCPFIISYKRKQTIPEMQTDVYYYQRGIKNAAGAIIQTLKLCYCETVKEVMQRSVS